jgi:hypothetical protein
MPDSVTNMPVVTTIEAAAKAPNVLGGANRARTTYAAKVNTWVATNPTAERPAPRTTVGVSGACAAGSRTLRIVLASWRFQACGATSPTRGVNVAKAVEDECAEKRTAAGLRRSGAVPIGLQLPGQGARRGVCV